MFEATLHSAHPDRQRVQGLILATGIAVTASATMLAAWWTLDRLVIDRVGGPDSSLEIAEFSLLPPPPVPDPPPPPDEIDPAPSNAPSSSGATATIPDEPGGASPGDPEPSETISKIAEPGGDGGIPTRGGCPASVCGSGPIAGPPSTGGGSCTGPACGVAPARPDPPPAEVEFSALRCLACADPDQAKLRRTASGMRRRLGSVAIRFCVDPRGRVEASSLEITRSYGDSAVDRIARAAVAKWRFAPMTVAGKARRACSVARFQIRFDP
jgi:TonB family protein